MMNKCISVALVLCMVMLVFAGCGSKSDVVVTTQSTTNTQPTEATVMETETEETEGISFELNRDDITLIRVDETLNLYDGDIPTGEITWGSENEAVATFSGGVVKAVSAGETVVYAMYDGIKASCKVYCNIKEVPAPPQVTPTEGTTSNTQPSGTTASGPREPVKDAPTQQTVDSSFFDDAVFVGDSISLKLSYYAGSSGELGKAKFLVRGSYGVGNEVTGAFYLTYQGQEMKLTDALAQIGAKKLFIMLGMNDIGLYGIDGTIANWGTMLSSIREKNPDIQIFIQSMTPVWTGGEKGSLKNPNVDSYNVKLKAFAQSNGCKFIDVAPYMKDSTGGLATRFCSDNYVHLSDEGAQRWIKVLKAYEGY